ncbi:DUF1643 domain-containing protein [Bacillus cereus group sp. MYBK65-1]|uniref:DUF1643 domain-containing protein n=1 Tax=unclassified Bacillus cereus group TaxID=2750818 RepID=UPI002A50010C|nr:DUF1643 domain-containing protein [Bacillus cereus]
MNIRYPEYVEIPTECEIKNITKEISLRNLLTAKLKNEFNKNFLFILMNPSKADNYHSDKTINKCAGIVHNDLVDLVIGQFSIVNVYPFYESDSIKLNDILREAQGELKDLYTKQLEINLKVIKKKISEANHVFLGTGGIPNGISNREEYQSILDTILSYLESSKGVVYLGTSRKYKGRYVLKNKYSYHICPRGNPNVIDKLKLHKVYKGNFESIPDEKEISLTVSLNKLKTYR